MCGQRCLQKVVIICLSKESIPSLTTYDIIYTLSVLFCEAARRKRSSRLEESTCKTVCLAIILFTIVAKIQMQRIWIKAEQS